MRVFIALVAGIVLGAGGAYLAIEQPWESDSLTPEDKAQKVADQLVRELRGSGDDADSASCGERAATNGQQYICTVDGAGEKFEFVDYVVTVRTGGIDYRRRFRP
jgi:hypothetical protein